MNLHDELIALSQAHGPAELAAAFRRLQGAVRRGRREGVGGPLAQTVFAALQIWDAQKAEGVSEAERRAGFEKTIRASWPFTREWKYLCGECLDTGLVMQDCDGGSDCGRLRAHRAHDYGRPCWCSLGARFKAKAKPEPEDFTQAGRTKPTRLGR